MKNNANITLTTEELVKLLAEYKSLSESESPITKTIVEKILLEIILKIVSREDLLNWAIAQTRNLDPKLKLKLNKSEKFIFYKEKERYPVMRVKDEIVYR